MAKTRVIVATPSMIDQSRFSTFFGGQEQFDLVAQTTDISATYARVEELMPDLVLVAESFAKLDEFECMKSLFRAVAAQDVVITQSEMLQPLIFQDDRRQQISSKMSSQVLVRILSQTIATAKDNEEPKNKALLSEGIHRVAMQSQTMQAPLSARSAMQLCPVSQSAYDRIILIGASTGGIDALTTILQHFPPNCPPTAIVQHTGRNFSETLAQLLDRRCQADVSMAKTGLEMAQGRICLAGGTDGHLRFFAKEQLVCQVEKGPAVSGHMPSIDEMFFSAAPFAKRVVAVLLTGMGRDGAAGLLHLREAGALTIGQDQATSIVYGMPRVAFELGAVQHQLPLSRIGPAILQLCTQSDESHRSNQVLA